MHRSLNRIRVPNKKFDTQIQEKEDAVAKFNKMHKPKNGKVSQKEHKEAATTAREQINDLKKQKEAAQQEIRSQIQGMRNAINDLTQQITARRRTIIEESIASQQDPAS